MFSWKKKKKGSVSGMVAGTAVASRILLAKVPSVGMGYGPA